MPNLAPQPRQQVVRALTRAYGWSLVREGGNRSVYARDDVPEVIPNGRHAFDLVDDNDASRAVVRDTRVFMKENPSPGVQAGLRDRAYQARAMALREAKDWPAAAGAFGAWLKAEPEQGWARQYLGEALYNLKRYTEAGQAYAKAGDLGTIPALNWYNGACSYALAGDKEKAIDLLTRAFGTGRITNLDQVRADADLASLRDDPRFAALVTATAVPAIQ